MTEKTETIGDIPHAQKILQKLKRNNEGIFIARLPPKTKEKFIALAATEFCGDYGFTMKFLMDDLISPDSKMLLENISSLESRIVELESVSLTKKEEPKQETTKMCDGSERNRS